MKNKIVGILVITLLILTTVLPVVGTMNELIKGESNTISLTSKTFLATAQNGVILDQELDDNNMGYTVIRVWGSDYEMGYAQAELLGDYIVQAVNETKDYLGDDYDSTREIIADAVWMPPGIEDEIDGMVDCLAVTHPSENIDELDAKVCNTLGDWHYACRSHTCWGRYVAAPIKTLSTRRLDFPIPFSSACHHVLCARDPTDGSPRWVNLGWPGYVLTVTGLNEYGTLVSSHDFQSHNADFSPGRMPRTVAFRYAMTFAINPDVSTHLTDTFAELQNYEIMTGSFLNYYAPEGHGGVMTCNPYASGSDFYDLRLPQESWHYGEAMITTNQWTDGTYTPGDEDFGADAYYDDETPKTQESHWNLLAYFGGHRGLHLLSVAYRDRGDMTVWAIGKLSALEKTPRLEYEWSDLLDLEPPEAPDIDGPVSGIVGIEYEYSFSTTDPDEDDVYYYIEWGDGQVDEWVGPYKSGETAKVNHTWTSPDNYEIRAKAKDTNNLESEWSDVYPVTIVESEPPNTPTIEGKTSGKAGTSYLYTFTSTDPNEDQVSYYIKWGDGSITDWTAFQASGPPGYSESHAWDEQGTYTIEAKAKDIWGAESDWAELTVTMPRNRAINSPFQWFLQQYPNLFPILRLLLLR